MRVLGRLEARMGEERLESLMGTRGCELLAYLVVFPGEHSRERLMTALWPEKDAVRGSANLRRALFLMRRALGSAAESVLAVSDATIGLRPAAVTSDLARLNVLLASGGWSDQSEAVRLVAHSGELLADTSPEWAFAEQNTLHRRVVDAGRAALLHEKADDAIPPATILELAHALLVLEPSDEAAHAAAIAARGAMGDRAGAAAHYRRCREVLERELGVEPGAEVEGALRLALASSGPPVRESHGIHDPLTVFHPAPVAAQDGALRPVELDPAAASDLRSDAATVDTSQLVRVPVGPARYRRGRVTDRVRVVAAAALVLVVGVPAVVAARGRAAAAEQTVSELINEHRFATGMETLPVVGADPRIVDEWFEDRVDYAVESTAGSGAGFTLVGGGLCDLSGRIAATAVYKAADGPSVAVFTFPAGALTLPDAPELAAGLRGLSRGPVSVVFSVHEDVVRAAVGDVPLDRLISLAPELIGPS